MCLYTAKRSNNPVIGYKIMKRKISPDGTVFYSPPFGVAYHHNIQMGVPEAAKGNWPIRPSSCAHDSSYPNSFHAFTNKREAVKFFANFKTEKWNIPRKNERNFHLCLVEVVLYEIVTVSKAETKDENFVDEWMPKQVAGTKMMILREICGSQEDAKQMHKKIHAHVRKKKA
jgi:hypothetical protein